MNLVRSPKQLGVHLWSIMAIILIPESWDLGYGGPNTYDEITTYTGTAPPRTVLNLIRQGFSSHLLHLLHLLTNPSHTKRRFHDRSSHWWWPLKMKLRWKGYESYVRQTWIRCVFFTFHQALALWVVFVLCSCYQATPRSQDLIGFERSRRMQLSDMSDVSF